MPPRDGSDRRDPRDWRSLLPAGNAATKTAAPDDPDEPDQRGPWVRSAYYDQSRVLFISTFA
jgi:hypothetical protein